MFRPWPHLPHQNIVGKVPRNGVGFFQRRREAEAKQSNVLMVPCVAVGNRRAVGNAGNLVAVVPPGHHARVGRRVFTQPQVARTIIIEQIATAVLGDDLRV